MKSVKTFQLFRRTAVAEGISFLLLLLVAMPLKYFAGFPLAVTIVGGAHGLLIIAFLILGWEVMREYGKSWSWGAKGFLASLLPFGTIVMDKQWRKEQHEIASGS